MLTDVELLPAPWLTLLDAVKVKGDQAPNARIWAVDLPLEPGPMRLTMRTTGGLTMPAPGRGTAVAQTGTVTAHGSGTVTVAMAGESYQLPYISDAPPPVGATVWVMWAGRTGLVLHAAAGGIGARIDFPFDGSLSDVGSPGGTLADRHPADLCGRTSARVRAGRQSGHREWR